MTVAPSCGAETFHLDTGDSFGLWARMETFEANGGFVDASHTFTVALNPDLRPETVALLQASIVQKAGGFGTAPEPATWGLLVLGFGGLGAMVRRRRAQPA